jgi:hypothetical protein
MTVISVALWVVNLIQAWEARNQSLLKICQDIFVYMEGQKMLYADSEVDTYVFLYSNIHLHLLEEDFMLICSLTIALKLDAIMNQLL